MCYLPTRLSSSSHIWRRMCR